MIIKEAEEKDLPSLYEIGNRIHSFDSKKELPFYLDAPGFDLYVLENDKQENIAFLCIRFEADTDCEIDYLAIRQDQEGKGLASSFLSDVIKELSQEGIENIFLEVRSRNLRAISLYERTGFKLYHTRKKYYSDDDALCYKKEIEK